MTSTTISEHIDVPDEFVWAGGAELSRHDGSADGIVEYWVGPAPSYHGLAAPAGTDGADRIKDQWAWSLVDESHLSGEEYQMAAEAWREEHQ